MKRKLPGTIGVYIERDILESDAYWSLTGAAPQVYMVFLMKRILSDKAFGKDKARIVVNNGEITYTFVEACKNYRIPKSTFLRARDQLIKVGFIEIADDGGCHHTTKYAISNNWRNYPEQTFERPKSGNLVGIKTRWTKDTVISDTNNSISTVISGTNSNPNGTEYDA
jgi:hypothetical protein